MNTPCSPKERVTFDEMQDGERNPASYERMEQISIVYDLCGWLIDTIRKGGNTLPEALFVVATDGRNLI